MEIEDGRFNFFLTVFVAAAVIGTLVSLVFANTGSGMQVVNQIDIDGERISLYSGCRRLDMVTSNQQIQKIENAQEGPVSTFGFFSDTLSKVGSGLKRVEITDIENGVYLAESVFTKHYFLEERVNSRPSDAIALAKASKENVYVSNELLVEEGDYYCTKEGLSTI